VVPKQLDGERDSMRMGLGGGPTRSTKEIDSSQNTIIQRFNRTWNVVDKILKGAKPEDLPVEQSTKFDLVINWKAAKQLGLTIPPEVLLQATKLVK